MAQINIWTRYIARQDCESESESESDVIPLSVQLQLNSFNMIEFLIQDVYFQCIKTGVKRFEGRRVSKKISNLKAGDAVLIVNQTTGETLQKVVRNIFFFSSIEDMVKEIGFLKLIPTVENEAEAVAIYYTFPGYLESRSFAALEFDSSGKLIALSAFCLFFN